MSLTVNDITTYLTGIVMYIALYFGIGTTTTHFLVQIIVPLIATILVSYLNEKYPSSLVTPVEIQSDNDGI